jgi:aspartate/methionine/tyrosine aminotransferase
VRLPLFLAKLLIRTGLARFLPAVQRLTEGGGDFLHYYSDQILTAPYAELGDAANFLEVSGPGAIDLALGSPRFDLVPSATTKLPADRRGFPPPLGLPELREAVASTLYPAQHLSFRPADEVLITHGAAGAFTVALDSFVNRGDRVVLFDPSSPLFILALRQRRARIRWVETHVEQGRLHFRLDRLAKALHRAKLIVVNSPANPTGGVIAPEDLEQIAWWARRQDALIYSDEVFAAYHYEGAPVSIATLPHASQRCLVAGSVSKSHALTAHRVGWLAGYRHLLRPCQVAAVLRTPFVPTLCQQVALAALRLGAEPLEPVRAEFEARRRYAFERLGALELKPAWPVGAFFFWVPVSEFGMNGRTFAGELLKAKRVLVWPGNHFGPSGSHHIRISYAAEDGRLREGLSRLGDFVRELRGASKKNEVKQAA